MSLGRSQQIQLPTSHTLSDDEEKRNLEEIIKGLQGDDAVKHSLEKFILSFNPELLYRLTANNVSLQNFCRHLIEAQSSWSKQYLQGKYLSVASKSMDGSDLMIYDLIMGMSLYSHAIDSSVNKNLKKIIINQACDWQFYDALLLRCSNNIKQINKLTEKLETNLSLQTLEETDEIINEIESDINVLKNRYWQIGYFRSGIFLNQLSLSLGKLVKNTSGKLYDKIENEDFELPDVKEKLIELDEKVDELCLESITHFLMAEHLEQHPESQLIVAEVTQQKGIESILTESGLGDWQQAKKEFAKWITTEDSRLLDQGKNPEQTIALINDSAKQDILKLITAYENIVARQKVSAKIELQLLSDLQMNSIFNRPISEVARDLNSMLKSKP
jgi:hypothetical protein